MNDNARNDAERLDALWDRFNRGERHERLDSGDDSLFLASLSRDLPRLSNASRERIRSRVFSQAEGATSNMSTITAASDCGNLAAPLPVSHQAGYRRHLDHPWLRAAAVLLLALSLIGGWATLRTDDDASLRGVTTYPAATGSSPNGAAIGAATPDAEISEPIEGAEVFAWAPIDLDLPAEVTDLRLVLSEIALEPGTSWTTPPAAALLFLGQVGEIAIDNGAGESLAIVAAGDLASFSAEKPLRLTNNGGSPAELVLGFVLFGDAGGPEQAALDDITIEILGTGSLPASGPITVAMSVESPSGSGSSTITQAQSVDGRLYAVLDGTLAITRLAGSIEVHRNGTESMTPGTLEVIGDEIELFAGESFFVSGGSSFSIETSDEDRARIATLIVHARPEDPTVSASPVASPEAQEPSVQDRTEGSLIQLVPTDCTIEPRSLDEFAAILADPFANGTPIANMQSESVAGMPADDETIAGVTDTIVQVVACNSPASIEMYSLYSENALRFQAMHGMTIAEIEGLPSFEPGEYPDRVLGHVTVENVTLLPDGRVTAMVNANGEIAFVTFVFENGRWLVDFWDDSLEN